MENKKSFGEFITTKRKEAGLTQKSFAEKLFITESAVSKWERGISYPDITLIRDICVVLRISEHELLTSSEDLEYRKTEKLARKYIKIISGFKYTLYFIFGISILTCFICNIAVQHTLSWFFIVLTAELLAFSITLLPILLSKNRGLITLGAFVISLGILLMTCCIYTKGDWFFVSIIPILFGITIVFLPIILNNIWIPEFLANKKALLCFIIDSLLLLVVLITCDRYTNGGWFLATALPIALFCLTLPWAMMLIIRYTRINKLFKTAGCFAVACIFVYCIQGILNMILENVPCKLGFQFDFNNWSEPNINGNVNMIIFFVLLGMVVLFAIAGIFAAIRKHKS